MADGVKIVVLGLAMLICNGQGLSQQHQEPYPPPVAPSFNPPLLSPWILASEPNPQMGFASSSCPEPRLRQAVIGGDTIAGIVLQQKPLKFAQVRLYDSSGNSAWVGTTDKDGAFTIKHLKPDTYRVEVPGWGSTSIKVDPKEDWSFPQKPNWFVQLTDHGCVGAGVSMD